MTSLPDLPTHIRTSDDLGEYLFDLRDSLREQGQEWKSINTDRFLAQMAFQIQRVSSLLGTMDPSWSTMAMVIRKAIISSIANESPPEQEQLSDVVPDA